MQRLAYPLLTLLVFALAAISLGCDSQKVACETGTQMKSDIRWISDVIQRALADPNQFTQVCEQLEFPFVRLANGENRLRSFSALLKSKHKSKHGSSKLLSWESDILKLEPELKKLRQDLANACLFALGLRVESIRLTQRSSERISQQIIPIGDQILKQTCIYPLAQQPVQTNPIRSVAGSGIGFEVIY